MTFAETLGVAGFFVALLGLVLSTTQFALKIREDRKRPKIAFDEPVIRDERQFVRACPQVRETDGTGMGEFLVRVVRVLIRNVGEVPADDCRLWLAVGRSDRDYELKWPDGVASRALNPGAELTLVVFKLAALPSGHGGELFHFFLWTQDNERAPPDYDQPQEFRGDLTVTLKCECRQLRRPVLLTLPASIHGLKWLPLVVRPPR